MLIVYRWKWRWIPAHNVYLSNSNFSIATWIVAIIHSRTGKQSSHQYTPNDTHNSLRRSINALFDLHGLLITFALSSVSVLYWLTQFSFFPIFSSIHRIKIFLSFLFRRLDFWLNSLSFVILFPWKISAVSHQLLCVSSFGSWTKPHWFSLFRCPL